MDISRGSQTSRITSRVLEKVKREGDLNNQRETPNASKGMEITSSEGIVLENGKCNRQGNKFGVLIKIGRRHRDSGVEKMCVPEIMCMS